MQVCDIGALRHESGRYIDDQATAWLAAKTSAASAVLLARRGRFVLDLAGDELPDTVLNLLGVLRSQAFAAVGEGGGSDSDTDAYDRCYRHLVVWDQERRQILGAYRWLSVGQDGRGPKGEPLYSETLYRYGEGFFGKIGPALELGRAFVTPGYQRTVEPLFLLWQGIGQIIARAPQHRFLFGAVSISKLYSARSRRLILSELWRERCSRRSDDIAASLSVVARRPVGPRRCGSIRDEGFRGGAAMRTLDQSGILQSLSSLDRRIRSFESDQRGLPVLIGRYLDLGGTFLAFHDDRVFRSIACLAVLDLLKVAPRALVKFLGDGGAQALIEHLSLHKMQIDL